MLPLGFLVLIKGYVLGPSFGINDTVVSSISSITKNCYLKQINLVTLLTLSFF